MLLYLFKARLYPALRALIDGTVICLSREPIGQVMSEAVQGLRLLWQETGDPDARHEMLRAAADLADCALAAYDGAETVRESLRKLSAQLNTESLHFS